MDGNIKKKAKRTGKYQNYSPKRLKAAIEGIKNGTLTPMESHKKYGIPRSTLISKIAGKRPMGIIQPGPDSMLGKQNEEILEQWMLKASARGFPITKIALCYSARTLLEEGHGATTNNYNPEKGPGRRWFEGFMNRHKTLSQRTAEYIHQGRAAATEKSIRNWFKKVREDLQADIDVFQHPERIFNCNETSFVLHPKSCPVIVAKGQKHVYDASRNSNKENLTVLVCGNTAGELVPPMTLVSYKKIPSDLAATANPTWPIGKTDSGWMTCAAFFEYAANIFEPHIRDVPKPVVLFLDNHSSHISLQLSEFCQEKGIILIALPPNCTHILQPLDVSFFAPLKINWSREIELYKLKNNSEPKKCHILPILENILKQDNFKKNLISGFKACGLSTLNPDLKIINFKPF